jgi:endonuclease/exonuclease/phosphatase (EEP) superfamily protein YafD
LHYIVLVLAIVLIVATLLPFLKREEWWIRDFDFPRVQILVLGGIVAGVIPYFTGLSHPAEIAVFVALIAALLYQAYRIFPYTRLAKFEVLPARKLDPRCSVSVLVANVLMDNREPGRLIRMIERYDPELVLLLEPDARWEADMRVIEPRYPKVVRRPLDNTYGMLLYSRLELIDPRIRYLIDRSIPSIHCGVRLGSGQVIQLHCVHPEPPSPTEASESTDRDAELIVVGKEVKERGEPAIVCGDLNDVAWSMTTSLFQKISGLLDPRKGRGMFSTFHAKYPMMRWPLDHVFLSEHFRYQDMKRLGSFGSDHFPVFLRVTFEPEKKEAHDKPQADAGDKADAQEKLAKAGKAG